VHFSLRDVRLRDPWHSQGTLALVVLAQLRKYATIAVRARLELPYFRNSGNVETSGCERMILAPHGGSSLDKAGESTEKASDLAGVFEPVSVPLAVRLVPHDLGQAERGQHGAHPLHAPADRSGDLAGAHLCIFCEQLNDREGYRISEQPTET